MAMIIQLDRRRIYIAATGLIILVLLLGFYHSPDYVPAEISKVKTHVSIWLSGQEPNLSDEAYKDHFEPPAAPTNEHTEATQTSHNAEGLKEATSDDEFYALPISEDDRPDILPPAVTSITSALASQASAALPAAHDFVNILPPVDILATLSTTRHASATATHTGSNTEEPPVWADAPIPEGTEGASNQTASNTTHTSSTTTDSRPIWADELPQATTLVTHILSASSSASGVATTSSVEEKWYLDEKSSTM